MLNFQNIFRMCTLNGAQQNVQRKVSHMPKDKKYPRNIVDSARIYKTNKPDVAFFNADKFYCPV